MISIIVPVYNAEKFLKKCITSIQKQTLQDWELILVDDGSSDSSGMICDMISKDDARIKVIHQSNHGVSAARNAGLDCATGDYVMFVDSDDWIEPTLCQTLLDAASQADLVIGGYKEVYLDKVITHKVKEYRMQFQNSSAYIFEQLYKENLLNCPVSKLYKRNLLIKQRFDQDVKLGEDFLFNLAYFTKCKSISVVETSAYAYNMLNENSATKKFREDDFYQVISLYHKGKTFVEQYIHSNSLLYALQRQLCLNGINLLQLLFYSERTYAQKKKLAMEILSNPTFSYICQNTYGFPMKYKIPYILCKKKSFLGIKLFFFCKRKIAQIRK